MDLATRAAEAARAAGDDAIAAMIERGRLEILAGEERATLEGRSVAALRVALWLPATDRVQVRDRPELASCLRRAIATALESPDAILRELIVLQERERPVERSEPGATKQERTEQALSPVRGPISARRGEGGHPYRSAPASDAIAPEVIVATAAALADATRAPDVARALRRSRMALDPLGPGLSRVTVALDPADLALLRRDPRARAAAVAAVESAAHTPAHRAADVAFVVRAASPEPRAAAGDAELELTSAARRAAWAVVPVARERGRTTLALIRDERVFLVHLTDGDSGPRAQPREVEVAAKDLTDETAALKLLEELERGRS